MDDQWFEQMDVNKILLIDDEKIITGYYSIGG